MMDGDKAGGQGRQSPSWPKRPDIVVIGAGIMGLWAAVQARRHGMSVVLVDAGPLAGGASGGLLGALMPHTPDRWNEKKQFQFDALLALEDEVAELEARTGLSTGYRRDGRWIPLPKPHLPEIARGHAEDARRHWVAGERRFEWTLRDGAYAGGLLAADAIAFGLSEDGFAARINPRGLTAALVAWLSASGSGFGYLERQAVEAIDTARGDVLLADGSRIACGHVIVAAGVLTGRLIEPEVGPFRKPPVVPVKGQSAMLSATLPPDMPVIYLDGLYIVPHEGGRVAIGSTSENQFETPASTDAQLEDLIEAARCLMPVLREAPVVERWAGLRPKAIGRDPMAGRLGQTGRLSVLTGGFKVSFGIAHALAGRVVASIASGRDISGIPASFLPENHLAKAR